MLPSLFDIPEAFHFHHFCAVHLFAHSAVAVLLQHLQYTLVDAHITLFLFTI